MSATVLALFQIISDHHTLVETTINKTQTAINTVEEAFKEYRREMFKFTKKPEFKSLLKPDLSFLLTTSQKHHHLDTLHDTLKKVSVTMLKLREVSIVIEAFVLWKKDLTQKLLDERLLMNATRRAVAKVKATQREADDNEDIVIEEDETVE